MIQAVLFDVDGVLLDSFAANLKFFQLLFAKAGYPAPTAEYYRPLFAHHLRDVIKILAHVSDDEAERVASLVSEDMFAQTQPLLKMPDGAKEVIALLSKDYKLGIVTSRIRESLFTSPEMASLQKYFSVAITYEDTTKHKPDPEPLLLACKKLGVSPTDAVYIGDADSDVTAAKAAGMKVIQYAAKPSENTDVSTTEFGELPRIVTVLSE